MANPRQTQSDQPDDAPKADAPKDAEPRFPRERLTGPEGPAITGVARHIIVGALHGDERTKFTRGDVEKAVAAFYKRPAQED